MNTLKLFIFLTGTLLVKTPAKAQSMKEELKQDYDRLNSMAVVDKSAVVISFDQLAKKWVEEWSANYYAAYANTFLSASLHDAIRQDAYLDSADKYLKKLTALTKPSDETFVLAAYVAYSRFIVDPSNRWKKYLPVMNDDLEKAKQINPANPRIYYLQGIPVFYKPKLFGGGKVKARPYFEKAKLLFATQQVSDILKPYWGEKDNAAMLAKCNE